MLNRRNRSRRWAAAGGLLVLTASAGALGWWAGRETLEPPRDAVPPPERIWYEATTGEVSDVIAVRASARWTAVDELRAGRDGTVTSIEVGDGAAAAAGDVIATIDLRPMIVLPGDTPAFRPMASGDVGDDVAQLQTHLADIGLFDPESVNGDYGAETMRAVREWQRDRGVRVTGRVELGEVVFVNRLPARLRWGVDVGDRVDVGAPLAEVLAELPSLTFSAGFQQLADFSTGDEIVVDVAGREWPGTVGPVLEDSDPAIVGIDLDTATCDDRCDAVAIDGTTQFPASLTIVAPISGVVIPLAAVTEHADGRLTVAVRGDGDAEVEIVASVDGMAVVEGIEAGTQVELPREPS